MQTVTHGAESLAAARKIGEQAFAGSKNLNVRFVILRRAHPTAPPGGQWRTLGLCSSELMSIRWRDFIPLVSQDLGCVIVWMDRAGQAVLVTNLDGQGL